MASEGETGVVASVTLNPGGGGSRGYLGIELTKAPVAPGTYFILVEPVGTPVYRVRGASFGLLQVWPANAQTTIQSIQSKDAGKADALRAVFNPLTEPGTKLFDPEIGVQFGAAGDAYVRVRAEGSPTEPQYPYEGICTPEVQEPPFNTCTWERWWKRRFAAFNRGRDDGTCEANGDHCDPGGSFRNYGERIVNNAVTFAPQLPPVI